MAKQMKPRSVQRVYAGSCLILAQCFEIGSPLHFTVQLAGVDIEDSRVLDALFRRAEIGFCCAAQNVLLSDMFRT